MLRATSPTFSTERAYALGRSVSVLTRSRKTNSSSLFSLRSSVLKSAQALRSSKQERTALLQHALTHLAACAGC